MDTYRVHISLTMNCKENVDIFKEVQKELRKINVDNVEISSAYLLKEQK